MQAISHILAGPVLVATVLRTGNGRPASPVRFRVYWSQVAERMGAPMPPPQFASRYEAEAMAVGWATQRTGYAPRVERARR
ncbi:hypothetical protein LJB71_13060 [Thermomonas sp. S9]|uniref:hypothetical protein n=1 Tax=Thermomonas sp. S9 TaxID=2885203 RepID=UPI00216B0407|nr:hypothetical protein [Thermomonas sp. S9]MCR6497058.1 hypothetical protein [Thermomonas sp. S9]